MNNEKRAATLNGNITGVTRLLMAQHGGMNNTQLARALGLDKALISRSFAGKRPWKIDEIEKLAELFDVSPTLFLEDPESLLRSR